VELLGEISSGKGRVIVEVASPTPFTLTLALTLDL